MTAHCLPIRTPLLFFFFLSYKQIPLKHSKRGETSRFRRSEKFLLPSRFIRVFK